MPGLRDNSLTIMVHDYGSLHLFDRIESSLYMLIRRLVVVVWTRDMYKKISWNVGTVIGNI